MSQRISKYGLSWEPDTDALTIEMFCIQKGGQWMEKGKQVGMGLFHHYKEFQKLVWPDEDHHRWSDLILSEILKNDITVLMGPKDSNKTHGMTKYALTDYFCFPENTLIVVSSTDIRSLEGRVWGDLKAMFTKAKERYEHLPGVVLDSKHAICTDDLSDEAIIARDMRKGILCIPCKTASGGQTNISAYVGMKQARKRYLADEFQFMSQSMYDSLGNANSGNFKMVCAGNPIGQGDPLDIISEPKGGWESMPEPEKTTVWDNEKFLRSRTVNLVGVDSPNFDYDQTKPPRYWYMINKDSVARTVAGYGENSHQYYSQCKGVRRSGLNARRVLTRELCKKFSAFDQLVWSGKPRIKVAATDAAYGSIGGDRCISGHIEFGECNDGKTRILIHPPKMVPVNIRKPESPEDQIAKWDMDYCEANNIPGSQFGYDSTGRGSLGTAFARIWKEGGSLINPIEFGGSPTDRPVSNDLFIHETKTVRGHVQHIRRLKLCSEHYRKFVTELWWTVRLAIESDQIRGLTEQLCKEGCAREWKEVAGNKIEIESKIDMKERMGYSPDEFDWLVTAVEMARRFGFVVSKLSNSISPKNNPITDYLDTKRKKQKELIRKQQLTYA